MLKLNKSIKQKERLELVLDKDLVDELELYLKIGKLNKNFTKEVEANDIIEQLIINMFDNETYQTLRKEYNDKLKEKREKARAKAREKKVEQQKTNNNSNNNNNNKKK